MLVEVVMEARPCKVAIVEDGAQTGDDVRLVPEIEEIEAIGRRNHVSVDEPDPVNVLVVVCLGDKTVPGVLGGANIDEIGDAELKWATLFAVLPDSKGGECRNRRGNRASYSRNSDKNMLLILQPFLPECRSSLGLRLLAAAEACALA